MRTAVELGSKPCFEGVTSALRFWVMESSTAPRDMRRKSDVITRGQTEGGEDDGKKEVGWREGSNRTSERYGGEAELGCQLRQGC